MYQNKKWNIINIISFIFPFIIVGILIMYYNFVRFDSIFDFGAHYNLTTNDMIHRGLNLDRIGLGLFSYLFEPVNIVKTFPFIVDVKILTTNYLGRTIWEPLLGGLFFSTPIVFIGFYILTYKKEFDKNIFQIGLMCYIFAIIIIVFDTQMAGILQRYITDFAWLFLVPTIIVLFHFDEKKDKIKVLLFKKKYLCLMILSLVYQFLIVFRHIDISFEKYSPDIFYEVKYFIEFWL